MRSLEENLTQYAAYHRDRRNIATHFIGVPMIVFAIILALATVHLPLGPIPLSLAALVAIASCAYYFRLDPGFGLAMAGVLFAFCAAASEMTARLGNVESLAWALGLFVAGWALQFLGHRFEGMKPAFFDDVRQLLIGPLFVCAEAFFLVGARPALRRHIEERVGPTVANRKAAARGDEVPHV